MTQKNQCRHPDGLRPLTSPTGIPQTAHQKNVPHDAIVKDYIAERYFNFGNKRWRRHNNALTEKALSSIWWLNSTFKRRESSKKIWINDNSRHPQQSTYPTLFKPPYHGLAIIPATPPNTKPTKIPPADSGRRPEVNGCRSIDNDLTRFQRKTENLAIALRQKSQQSKANEFPNHFKFLSIQPANKEGYLGIKLAFCNQI